MSSLRGVNYSPDYIWIMGGDRGETKTIQVKRYYVRLYGMKPWDPRDSASVNKEIPDFLSD